MTFTGQVQVDFVHDPTSASFTWVDITNRAREAKYKRGRNYERAQVEAGEGTLKLRNDDGALDPTNGASAFSPNVLPFRRFQHNVTVAGPGTVPIFTGLVERWPQEWDAGYGSAPVQVVDIFAWLALAELRTAMQQEVLADAPLIYLPLTDASGTTAPAMVTAPAGAVSAIRTCRDGGLGGTFAFGSGTGPTAEGAGALLLSPGSTNQGYVAAVDLVTPILGGATTAAIRVNFTGTAPAVGFLAIACNPISAAGVVGAIGIGMDATGKPTAWVNGSTSVLGPTAITDGVPHDIVVTMTPSATTLYVDNVSVGTAAGGFSLTPVLSLQVGGVYGSGAGLLVAGSYSHAAVWSGNTPNVANEYNAGANGFVGETADSRIARILRYAGWTAATTLDACSTTMLSAQLGGKSALAAIQDVQASEGGVFFASKAGVLTYKSRRTRMQTTTSSVTFGENTAGGEVPYVDIALDFDPTYVYNDVQISRTSSGHAVAAADSTSQGHYGKRTYSATFNTQSDSEAQDAANWTLNTSLAPHARVRSVTVDCLATPGAWAAVLPLEIGSRVTVKRRPNNTAPVITVNSFVESIAWDIVDSKRARCTLELSPIPVQALIADDATYGLCDSTFVAAW